MIKIKDRLIGLDYRYNKLNMVIIDDTMDLLNLLTDFHNEVSGCKDYEYLWEYFVFEVEQKKIKFSSDFVENTIINDRRVTKEDTKVERISNFVGYMIEKVCNHTTESDIVS